MLSSTVILPHQPASALLSACNGGDLWELGNTWGNVLLGIFSPIQCSTIMTYQISSNILIIGISYITWVLRQDMTLQWHYMNIMASKSNGNLTVFQHLFRLTRKQNIKAMHYWPFVRVSHKWPVDSPHKGLVMQNVVLCHDVIMRCVWAELEALFCCLCLSRPCM